MNKTDKVDNINKVIAMVVLLILCIACLGMGITGAVVKFKALLDSTKPDTGPVLKDFFQDGKLNFYEGDELIAEYDCQSSFCGWAYQKIDDVNYALKYYEQEGVKQYTEKIDGRYAFIVDGDPSEDDQYYYLAGVKIYDVQEKKVIGEYNSIKNYGTTLLNNTYIAQDKNGKWGVIDLQDGKVNTDLNFEYDFIGIFYRGTTDDETSEPLKDVSKYVVLQDGGWYVIDSSGSKLTSRIPEPIQGYEGNIVIAGKDTYSAYNKNGSKLFTDGNNVIYTGKDVVSFNNDTDIEVIDALTGEARWQYSYSRISSVALEDYNANLNVVVNGITAYTYELK